MLQVVLHSWIACLLFLWIGEMYEVHGSRCSMHYTHAGRSTTVVLVLLLANSVGVCCLLPLVLMVMYYVAYAHTATMVLLYAIHSLH